LIFIYSFKHRLLTHYSRHSKILFIFLTLAGAGIWESVCAEEGPLIKIEGEDEKKGCGNPIEAHQ
jgi:hypothetical protein